MEAQVRLASLLAEGLGTDRDLNRAFGLFQSAADQKHPHATLILGTMYEKGLGTDISLTKAAQLYEIAADLGMAEGATNLGVLHQTGILSDSSFEQAKYWYERGGEMGDVRAVNNLGVMNLRGEGVEKNPQRAAELFQIAVDNGSTEAMNNLGSLYESALGVPLDEAKAQELYARATENSRRRRTSTGLPAAEEIVEIVQAENFDRKAIQREANAGDAASQHILGYLHMNGWGTPQDYVSAYAWFNLSAAHSNDVSTRDTLAKRMTVSQINAAQTLSRQLSETIAASD